MSRPRLAVLNAARGDGHTERNFRRELDADLVEFALVEGELPDSFGFDGVVVSGSRRSVYHEEEWIVQAREWTRRAAQRGLPCLGVCFGHQLLADALGGRVAPMDSYELGYREIRRTADAPLLEGLEETFTAFTTHSDAVVELPPGAELLAENDRGVHAFRKGDAYGVQFHPEYDVRTAREVTEGKEGEADPDLIEHALEGITDEAYTEACEAKRLFENFVDLAARTSARGSESGASAD